MDSPAEITALLRGVDLFSALGDEELDQIASVLLVQDFKAGETVILEKDEDAHALYIIASGEIQIFITGVGGRETILSLLSRGDFFGEIALIDGEPRSASARTVTDTKVFILLQKDFLELLDTKPGLAKGILLEMSARLRRSNRQIGSLSTMSVYGRVASTILNLVEERGVRMHTKTGECLTVIKNRPTQQQLADMSGTTRETVSRVCSMLVKKGAISMTGKELIVFEEALMLEVES